MNADTQGLTAWDRRFYISGQRTSWEPEPQLVGLPPSPGHKSYRERLPATVAAQEGTAVGWSAPLWDPVLCGPISKPFSGCKPL